MSGYALPNSVNSDFQIFKQQYSDYLSGKLDALTFKTIRVPFGIYEQRESNTFMVRVKLAAGVITPDQLITLAQLADDYAAKNLHVTTRGGVQLHYVKIEDFLSIIEKLHNAELTGRGGGGNTVRNITADPYSGIASDELFDVTPYALALGNKMLEQKDSYSLPRKYKIAFSGSSADCGGATFSDVGFIAKIIDGKRGFSVVIAGGMGTKPQVGLPFIDFLPDNEVFLLSQAIKEVFDERGNRKNKHAARLRFLAREIGIEEFRKLVDAKTEKIRAKNQWELELPKPLEIVPQENEALPSMSNEESLWWKRFAQSQKQKGYYCTKIPLYLGDISAQNVIELANALKKFTAGSVRLSSDQNIYLRNLRATELLSLYPILKQVSPLVTKPALLGDAVVCTGSATCQLGITIPRGALKAIEKALALANIDLDAVQGLRIHMSGCPNSCGRHAIADLGFFGKVLREGEYSYPAYNIMVGARISEGTTRLGKVVADISAFHLPTFIAELLRLWIPLKKSYKSFADWIDDGGESVVAELAKKYSKVPSFEEDKNPYFDYSSNELFSLKGRGTGECSAGMYDLIEADKKALSTALHEDLTVENLANIRLLSARMLLVTRGEDARSEHEVLIAFKKHFIDTGLIEASLGRLLEGEAKKDVISLATAVIALYDTMDNTLKFAAELKPIADSTNAPARFKDYRGVACPMNFVKTKMDLSQMKSGEMLEILLDDGAPIDNVPKSVMSEGHMVTAQTKEDGHWRVKIIKK